MSGDPSQSRGWLASLALIGSWLLASFGPFSFIGVLLPFLLAAVWWKRQRGWALTLALLSPLVALTVLPVALYFKGSASLHFHGLPGAGSFNLDRQTRLPRSGGGCIVDGGEWLTDGWNNLVLRSCVRIFGPMRGMPAGPYPAEAELTGKWQDAEAVSAADLRAGVVKVGGTQRDVPSMARILEAHAPWAGIHDDYHETAFHTKDFGDLSFALRISVMWADEPEETTILFGGQPSKVIGYFSPKRSDHSGRFPAVKPGS